MDLTSSKVLLNGPPSPDCRRAAALSGFPLFCRFLWKEPVEPRSSGRLRVVYWFLNHFTRLDEIKNADLIANRRQAQARPPRGAEPRAGGGPTLRRDCP